MTSESKVTTEVRFLDSEKPLDAFTLVQPREREMEYYIEHHGDSFFVLTNDCAKNFKLMEAPVSDPGKHAWREVIPHRQETKIDAMDAFANHLVVYERKTGLKKIRILNLKDGTSHDVKFPEAVYSFWPGDNHAYDTNRLRLNYTSLTASRTVYDYDMDSQSLDLLKRYEVLGGYEAANYVAERVFATATDATRVPISLVYRKGLKRDGSNPLVLLGYGSYGTSIEPSFLSTRLSLLDRGFVFAIAHVRGGGEMGRDWYDKGRLLNKRNTFTDFIACSEYLIRKKYTSQGKIVAIGGSAGGMLVGAVANMRPELFRGIVAHVPFVDVVNTMLDESLPLTVVEYEEWGDPRDKMYYEYIRSYSPYDMMEPKGYPHILVTGGLNDSRVQYWEPAKWVAKLRATKTDDNLLVLKLKMEEGHAGASGRYDYLREVAFDYAFILDCFGVNE